MSVSYFLANIPPHAIECKFIYTKDLKYSRARTFRRVNNIDDSLFSKEIVGFYMVAFLQKDISVCGENTADVSISVIIYSSLSNNVR